MQAPATVFVVDDDPGMRSSLARLLKSAGYTSETYNDAETFLASYDSTRAGCLILDVRLTGMTGLELQSKLSVLGIRLPVIIISGFADVPKAVQAMRAGALDFLEKPFDDDLLVARVRQALESDAAARWDRRRREAIAARVAALTRRQRETMKLLSQGKSTKEIAAVLGISIKTVDNHRAQVFEKMQVESVAELVSLLHCLGDERSPSKEDRANIDGDA